MSETAKRVLTALVCILMGCAVGTVVTVTAFTGFGTESESDMAEDILRGSEKYTEIMELVDDYFIGEDVDMTLVNDSMASAVISALGDRWSYYISAEDYQSYLATINNSYVGVGITITAAADEDGSPLGFTVTDTSEGGPAREAGVQAGDVLIRVDGEPVEDLSVNELKSIVQGEAGTTVDMTFLRDGNEITLTVERRTVTTIPAEGELLDGGIGYIIIDNFDAGCSDAVKSLIEELQDEGATSILFDVRNNPGGLKSELTNLLDYLLPEGTIFHSVNYAGEEEIVTSDADCVDLPMAVLVNESSYSAAEYFACAIQEYGAGIVVGQQTYGKGYYQVGLTLSDGSCVNLSIGKYYTPNGLSLIDVGVTPDIEVLLDDSEAALLAGGNLEPAEDPQLQAAVNWLLAR